MNTLKAVIKFLPIVVLAGLMMTGQDALLAAPIAAIAAVVVARLTEKRKLNEGMDASLA